MATVTKPIALDESINTTESPSRNVADVLAQELSGIASAITGGSNKVPKTDIATVEPSNTASRAYSVGELVYVNGNLYKVITAIANGSTFTVGTNIQSTNVSERIRSSWTTVATTCGACSYNDDWVIYDMTNGPVVNITTPWVVTVVDTLPVAVALAARSTGFWTNNLGTSANGEVNISGTSVTFTSYGTPLTGTTIPVVRTYIMPRH